MDLKQYFTSMNGVGVLSTADDAGRINGAIYSRPHILDDGSVCFIMHSKLTRENLKHNPYAHYLFLEKGAGYSGMRMHLEKVKEVQDEELITQLSRRKDHSGQEEEGASRFLVSFKVVKIVELLGDKELVVE